MKQNDRDRMKTIGITGGIGAGKSQVLLFLEEEYKAYVLQADLVGHLVMEPGMPCYEPVVSLFGPQIVKKDKTIDRRAVAEIVFVEPEKREKLNAVIHPAVKQYILERREICREEGCRLFIVEAAILLESGYGEFCDEIWYIYADEAERRRRLMESRAYSPEKIQSVMKAQQTDAFFREHADFVVDNSGSFTDTEEQIRKRLTLR